MDKDLQILFSQICTEYLNNKTDYDNAEKDSEGSRPKKHFETHKNIIHEIPRILREKINSDKYLVRGSNGQGDNLILVPWIAIFDKKVTESATKGYYIVYLFAPSTDETKMNGVYISLALGWTQYQKRYKGKGLEKIARDASWLQGELRTRPKDFSIGKLNLGHYNNDIQGYEEGSIVHKYYNANSLPSSKEIIDDLNALFHTYEELKGIVPSDMTDLSQIAGDKESVFQPEIQDGLAEVFVDHPEPKDNPSINIGNTKKYVRNQKRAINAIARAKYTCEIDTTHFSFINQKGNKMYVEAHHLIPIFAYDDFQSKIDVEANIVSLCPNCHRIMHHATEEVRSELLSKLHAQRINRLMASGIEISLPRLLSLYRNEKFIDEEK